MSKQRIAIVGGGLVGGLQAIYMAQRGHEVHVFERRDDIRTADISAGKSINLAMSDRGWKALADVGLEEEIRAMAIPMNGRIMHSLGGELTFQPYGKEGQAIWSVSRGGLNQALLDKAAASGDVHMSFKTKVDDIDLATNTLILSNEVGTEKQERFDRIFGTDGAFSAVRMRLQKTNRFNYSQKYIESAYKELEIPANEDGSHKLDPNALHIWPRRSFMLIALANMDGSFTVTLFLPWEGESSFESLNSDQAVMDFFQREFPDAMPILPNLVKDFNTNPTGALVTVKCSPWNYKGQVALMGDAAHAVVPFYGQGMNAGFEDCSEFHRVLNECGDDWDKAFEEYSRVRVANGQAIADLAEYNYIVMRDKTADAEFLLQKKIEGRLSEKFPDKWLPLYSQVTFSHIPYSTAMQKGFALDALMKEFMARPGIENDWDSDALHREILEKAQAQGLV